MMTRTFAMNPFLVSETVDWGVCEAYCVRDGE